MPASHSAAPMLTVQFFGPPPVASMSCSAIATRKPLGELGRLLDLVLGQHDRELLAADARDDELLARVRGERARDALQHAVAGRMAVSDR